MYGRSGKCENLLAKVQIAWGINAHCLHAEDRLNGKDIKFAIGFAYGDRDFFSSDGADSIVKKNAHFKTGESQIFKIENCGHNMFYD